MNFPLDDFLKDLEKIINIDSGTHNIEGNLSVAAFFEEQFKAAGFDVRVLRTGESGRPLVVASSPGNGSFDFLLCGHMDTVFADGTAAKRPFRVEDGCAFGPGTVDMKAGALLMLYLARHMAESRPDIRLKILLNSDEETGSEDTSPYMLREACGCGAIFVFEGARKRGQFVAERKGISKYTLEITGIPSHAGTAPKEGVSAITELARWITALDRLKNYDRGTTVNVGTISGGTALNVVAPSATATFEVRYRSTRELARTERALKRLVSKPFLEGAEAKLTLDSRKEPLEISEQTSALIDILEPLGLEYVSAGGTSDANILAALGIPVIDGCGPGGGNPHTDKEFLKISTVTERFDIMCRIFELLKK
ncbi:MAG: M20 family metallopeptidase [Firmicutes bacterium]|nr:M20 family metallopeptidase [Bacillota bacterium]